ncbi:TauD/TfdA family dioxygenase [Pseudomonas sp. HK3]
MNIEQAKKELEYGKGWVVLQDIDLTNPEASFIELMNQFGTVLNQNNNGDAISYIQDKGVSTEDVLNKGVVSGDNKGQTNNRPYLTNAELEFHTDLSDIAFLLSVQPAQKGGENHVVNSEEVYSYIKEHHPEDLVALSDTFKIMHQTPLKPDGKNHLISIPVFTNKEGFFSSFLLRAFIFITYEKLGLDLSLEKRDALNRINEVATKLCTTLTLRKGEVLILNNHTAYHARSSFNDRDRLLLRGWVCADNNRPLHDDFKELYGNLSAGSLRGGFVQL